MKLEKIVFDLDNTLLPSTDAYECAYQSLFSKKEKLHFSRARKQVQASLSTYAPSRHQRILYFKTYLEITKSFSAQKTLELTQTYEKQMLSYLKNWPGLKAQRKILNQLAQKFHLTLLTNENLRTQLLKIKLLDPQGKIFSKILTSEEAGHEKPHPMIFSRLRKELQLRHFQNCIYVGDSWTSDIQPALKNKFKKVIFSRQFSKVENIPSSQQKSIFEIHHLSEVLSCCP